MSHIETFNTQLNLLLEELIRLFPDEKDIVIFQSQLEFALLLNQKRAYESFMRHIYPHQKEIMSENEDFFLDKSKDLENDYMSKMIHMTHLWKDRLNEENKKIVWKYFKVLCLVAEKMR